MKKIIVFCILNLTWAFAGEVSNSCSSRYKMQKDALLWKCELNYQGEAIQLVKLENYCMEYEGEKEQSDCYIVQSCPKNSIIPDRKAPAILPKHLTNKTFCNHSRDYTLFRHEKIKAQAFMLCEKNKPKAIKLNLSGVEKICPLNK